MELARADRPVVDRQSGRNWSKFISRLINIVSIWRQTEQIPGKGQETKTCARLSYWLCYEEKDVWIFFLHTKIIHAHRHTHKACCQSSWRRRMMKQSLKVTETLDGRVNTPSDSVLMNGKKTKKQRRESFSSRTLGNRTWREAEWQSGKRFRSVGADSDWRPSD